MKWNKGKTFETTAPITRLCTGKHKLYLVGVGQHELVFKCRKCYGYGTIVQRWAYLVMIKEGRMAEITDEPAYKEFEKRYYGR